MTCSYCASELPAGALFCGECGRSVTAKLTTTPLRSRAVRQPAVTPVPPEPESIAPETTPAARPSAPVAHVPSAVPRRPVPEMPPAQPEPPKPAPTRPPVAPTPPPPPQDTAAIDPVPWAELEPMEIDLEATRIVRRSGARFVLQFSTGESVSVAGTGLIGRNPIPEPGEFFDSIVVISDAGKSVSKTHLEFGQDAGTFWISDRFSGNGTTVREPEGAPRRCDAGKRYRIARGTRVDIGEQFFIVS